MASSLRGLATALPEHRLDTTDALSALSRLWPEVERLAPAETAVRTRYLCEPLGAVLADRGLGERNAAYARHARRLAAAAARGALEAARVAPADVDIVISVSCTGYVVPSLDVQLTADLGLRADVIRLPITELGCSGGAAGLAFAHRHLLAFPEQTALVTCVELPSLTFQPGDRSLDNLTACLVFGDGAGAAVLDRGPGGRLRIEDAASTLIPGTSDLLGFELRDGGFHVVLDRRLPRVLARDLGPAVDRFLGGRPASSLGFIAAHAGGPRILDAVEAALGLAPDALDCSRAVFGAVGNTSSAAIFFTLERLLATLGAPACEGLGLGLGPGVTAEMMRLAFVPSEDARHEAGAPGERLPVLG